MGKKLPPGAKGTNNDIPVAKVEQVRTAEPVTVEIVRGATCEVIFRSLRLWSAGPSGPV
jgi:hypothetical protein